METCNIDPNVTYVFCDGVPNRRYALVAVTTRRGYSYHLPAQRALLSSLGSEQEVDDDIDQG